MTLIDVEKVPERHLLQHAIYLGRPAVVVGSWPKAPAPLEGVRILQDARLYDLQVGEFDLMGSSG